MKYSVVFLFTLMGTALFGQHVIDDSLAYFGDVMRNANRAKHRLYAADQFMIEFESRLSDPLSYTESWDEIKDWVSIQSPPDSSFRLITWQVDADETFDYQGYLQLPSGELYKLDDMSSKMEEVEYEVLNTTEWYGGIYYDVKQIAPNVYLILGFNGVNSTVSRKVADILDLSGDTPMFGKEVFYVDQDPVRPHVKTRIVLEYSDMAAVRLTYDKNENLLFFDNLIAVESYEKEGEVVMVQDGSYSGYRLKDDKLIYVDKLFEKTVDEPPRERPVQKNNKDIMGRPPRG